MTRLITATIATLAAVALSVPTDAAPNNTLTPVVTPTMPRQVMLCGEAVDLDNADLYERFDRELTSLCYAHGTTLLIIKRANRYFPQIAPILKRNGVPSDFLYLACVESSMSPRAYSPAKAAGIWQFIPATAKQYGLEVNDEVDERYNIEKSTAAACKYFKKAYAQYNDWPSVMAAFNGGMSRITKELAAQGVDSALDLYLAEETMRYPVRVAAMKMVLERPANYGFVISADQLYQPRRCKVVKVSGPVADWPAWAREHGITYAQLRDENPWIRAKTLTNKAGKTYYVRVPKAESLKRSTQGRETYNHNWTNNKR